VKAYLRRGTAREMMGYYKEAVEGQLTLCPLGTEVFFFVCVKVLRFMSVDYFFPSLAVPVRNSCHLVCYPMN
jgi:hypothetical protein